MSVKFEVNSESLFERSVDYTVIDDLKAITFYKATITRCDLSSRFFCIDATLLCEFESDKI